MIKTYIKKESVIEKEKKKNKFPVLASIKLGIIDYATFKGSGGYR